VAVNGTSLRVEIIDETGLSRFVRTFAARGTD
jgi:hypothetical protein